MSDYRKRANIGFEISLGRESLWAEIRHLYASLISIVDGVNAPGSGNLSVLRLATALLDYGMSLREVAKPKSYPTLGPRVQDALRDFLDYALAVHLNVSLPDPLDKIWIGDMGRYCLAAWKKHAEQE